MYTQSDLTPLPANVTEGQMVRMELRSHTDEDRASFSGLNRKVDGVTRFMYILTGVGMTGAVVAAVIAWSARTAVNEAVARGVSSVAADVGEIKESVAGLAEAVKSGEQNGTENRTRIMKLEDRQAGRHGR